MKNEHDFCLSILDQLHIDVPFDSTIYCMFSTQNIMREMYKLWINKFCMIYIIKSWDVKFLMIPILLCVKTIGIFSHLTPKKNWWWNLCKILMG
jgi:hypothetical protein